MTHLALGHPITDEAGIRALARSPLGERLEVFELHRNEVTHRMAELIIEMPSLHTFAYSRGHGRQASALLVEHFGKRAVVCDDEIVHVVPRGAERVLALLSSPLA